MDKKIGYGIAGSVLVLALVFSLYTPESNLVGYASKSLVVDDLFDTGSDDVVQQMVSGGGDDFPPQSCSRNLDCPVDWYCNAGGTCQHVGRCLERGRCGMGCVHYEDAGPYGTGDL
jgi:hypothetical protein